MWISCCDASAEDDRFWVVCEKSSLYKLSKMVSELIPECLCGSVAGLCFGRQLGSCGFMSYEEWSAAVCLIVLVEVAEAADLTGSGVTSFVEVAVYDDTGTNACAEGDTYDILISTTLSEAAFSE